MADKLSIAELAAAIKRREPRLANVPDDVLVRKTFERRPELMKIVVTSEPRPAMGSLYERIGGRLKQDLNLPVQAQGAAQAIHEGLRNIREHGPSQMPAFLGALKQYSKPENVIGDALAMLIAGQAGGGSGGRGASAGEAMMPKATPRTPATMESMIDMATRRGPGEPPPTAATPQSTLAQQYSLVESLKSQFEKERAANDPNMWKTGSKFRDAQEALRQAEKEKWGKGYENSPKTLSREGGGGANFSADDLAEFKKKWGIH